MSGRLSRYHNIAELRAAAKRKLPRGIFEYVDRGTEDEHALRRNREAIERITLRPRMAVNVVGRSSETTLFGKKLNMPYAVSPTGATGLMWYEGELELARAAAAAGVPFTLATGSMTAMEKIAREAGGRIWFQLYQWADRSLSYEIVDRAASLGFEVLIVTLDNPVSPNREYNYRNGFNLPFHPTAKAVADTLLHPRWLLGTLLRYLMVSGMPRYENHPGNKQKITTDPMARTALRTDTISWDDISLLRERWRGPLIVKGILHPQDAELALARGVDGVLVSNHGGRNLDSAIASFDALPDVVAAVGGRVPVLVDSGVRRGGDIFKAVALGAQVAMAGRPTLYGTAIGGQAGASRALALIHRELDIVMGMMGCNSIAEIGPHMLA